VSGDLNELPKEKVDRSVITYILGGVNISGGHFQHSPIGIGDKITQSIMATTSAPIFADLHRVVKESLPRYVQGIHRSCRGLHDAHRPVRAGVRCAPGALKAGVIDEQSGRIIKRNLTTSSG
jgi:hypothetical protein